MHIRMDWEGCGRMSTSGKGASLGSYLLAAGRGALGESFNNLR